MLNAGKADKLASAKTITLSGDVSGSVSFDGSQNVNITTSVANDSHYHSHLRGSNEKTTLSVMPNDTQPFVQLYNTSGQGIFSISTDATKGIGMHSYDNNIWESCTYMYSPLNKPTPADIDAAPASHSHSNYTPYATKNATTAATAGWYRIATSAESISNCNAIFSIVGAISGKHSSAIITAGTSYGIADNSHINVLQCSHYSGQAITKARIVYHTTYSGKYAYLEIYQPTATATSITVKMIAGTGWSLVAPNTAGSIPSGYSNKEVTLTNATITAASFAGSGASLTSLNAANISSGTLAIERGGTGATTAAAALTNLGAATANHTHTGMWTSNNLTFSLSGTTLTITTS